MRVLVVEDSEKLRRSLVTALRRSGYAVDECGDGAQAYRMASEVNYDLIVLDLMLPEVDGMTVMQRVRERGCKSHILLLTAKDTVEDRVRGLRGGADDYLVKPFALAELLARVDVLARRNADQKTPLITLGDLSINTAARTVSRAGQPIALTPREYALFEFLALRRGHVVSRTEIESHIYDSLVEPMSNVVDSAVCALRRKLGGDQSTPLIQTRRGMGYIIPGDLS